jgi:hypothetical protein
MQVQLSWRGIEQGLHMVEVADPLAQSPSCRADAGRLSLQIQAGKHWPDLNDLSAHVLHVRDQWFEVQIFWSGTPGISRTLPRL